MPEALSTLGVVAKAAGPATRSMLTRRNERPVIVLTRARFCTHAHSAILVSGRPAPRWPRHVDLELEVHKREGALTTLHKFEAACRGVSLEVMPTGPIELEPGRAPKKRTLILGIPDECDPVAGDKVTLSVWSAAHKRPFRRSVKISG
jgi:hypothetical protein